MKNKKSNIDSIINYPVHEVRSLQGPHVFEESRDLCCVGSWPRANAHAVELRRGTRGKQLREATKLRNVWTILSKTEDFCRSFCKKLKVYRDQMLPSFLAVIYSRLLLDLQKMLLFIGLHERSLFDTQVLQFFIDCFCLSVLQGFHRKNHVKQDWEGGPMSFQHPHPLTKGFLGTLRNVSYIFGPTPRWSNKCNMPPTPRVPRNNRKWAPPPTGSEDVRGY